MAREVDELFGEGEGAPTPRSTLIWSLLGTGVVLAVLGLACSAAPGGVLVLFAWMVVEKEMDRVDNGYLPADTRPTVQRLRTACYLGLLVVIAVFVLQAWLFCGGFYEWLWGEALRAAVG